MKTADINSNLIDSYYTLLKSLSADNKLELIARLSKSMKTSKEEEKDMLLDELYGSWISDQSADEIVEELKEARKFNRQREKL